MASRLKAVFILAAPFLLSALVFAALAFTDARILEIQSVRARQEWHRIARQGLHRLRASHTLDSQFEMMGVRFENLLLEASKRSRKGSLFDSGIPEAAFARAYPPTYRPAGTLLLLFGVTPDGHFKPLPHKSMPRMKVKLLAELMDFYRETAESGVVDPGLLKKVASKNSLIFGPWTPPRLISGREGRVTPARFEETDSMMMWRTINHGKTVFGGVMIIWPLRLTKSTTPLRYALESAARSSGSSFYPLLVPLPGLSARQTPVLPRSTAALARTFPRTFRRLVEAAPRMKRGRINVFDDFMVFREYFSPQHPYDMLAIAPVPKIETPVGSLMTAYRSLFLLFWGFIFGYVAVSGRPPPVSLRTMFRTLFLLVASLPLGMLAGFGYLQISTETQRAIDTVETTAVDTLNSLDIRSRQSLGKFSRVAQKVFSSPSFVRNVTSTSTADVSLAAKEIYTMFQASGETLKNVFLFQPGKQSRSYTSDGEDRDAAEKLDFFAGIINLTHNALISRFGTFDQSDIMLDTESQKSWRMIFESFGVVQFSTLFYNLMETGQMTSASSEEIGLHVSQMFFASGVPRAYVLLSASAREAQKVFLTQQINHLNLRYPARHACGDITPGGATVYHPAQNAGFWNTSAGRLLRESIDHSAISDTPITICRGNQLAVAAPCRTLGPMITASLWSLDEILEADSHKKLLLGLFTMLLGLIAFLLARLTADHLVTPLETVERTLKSVSAGDLSCTTGLERPDELGRMTASFDAMISGLRERRELGKFVSGAIESTLGPGDIQASRASTVMGTILVSDIRSFTTMSESNPPAEIVDLLNVHMEAMTSAIIRHGGRVDRFIGDAVVALFLTPEQNAGASSAVAAALDMNAASDRINQGRRESGTFTYGIGIGIATGELMTGSLDGGRRRDFIVIGEPRSRAEILENRSKKGRHTRIIVDQATAAQVDDTYIFENFPQEHAAELVCRKGEEA